MYILGISAYYHDSAACILHNGEIIAAAQEERFTRVKHDKEFPNKAVEFCLKEAGISLTDVEYIAFYDKPLIKFERLLETYLSYAPIGLPSFLKAMPVWLKEKLFLKSILKKEFRTQLQKNEKLPKLLFGTHHQSHAASAFFPSPYNKAAVLCMDGVGEWATTSVWLGDSNKLIPKWEMQFPHSIGLLYSALTYYTGFKVNSGEYKVMGLAPYGEPKYTDIILNELIDLKEDGTFKLNMKYFNFATGLTMTNKNFDRLFGGPPRKPESPISQKEIDLARSVQDAVEEIILRLGKTIKKELDVEYLCLAGGVALNCVANGKLLRKNIFKDIWIQPAAGDAGGALGVALSTWHEYLNQPRTSTDSPLQDKMKGSYLGPSFNDYEIEEYLKSIGAKYLHEKGSAKYDKVSEILNEGKVVGWFQGKMEFGPRALGNRSIIGDSRSPEMQKTMNLKIKYRESFRPFAPIVLAEDVGNYFKHDRHSPYMLMVAPVKETHRIPMSKEQENLFGIEKLNVPRSNIPAVTHVDYSARLQTVHSETNSSLHRLLTSFKQKTECSVLVNTSFNVRGEPIVCTPEDAFRCFMRTEMDCLVLENFILLKEDQPTIIKDESWKEEFALD